MMRITDYVVGTFYLLHPDENAVQLHTTFVDYDILPLHYGGWREGLPKYSTAKP